MMAQHKNKTCFLFTNCQPKKRMEEQKMGTNEYIYPVLLSMYNEQSDHIHSRFNEAYVKVSEIVQLLLLLFLSFATTISTTAHIEGGNNNGLLTNLFSFFSFFYSIVK